MTSPTPETRATPDRLLEALPAPPGDWTRTDREGGIVEYRLPADDGVCDAAKLVVRPELFADAAVRVDRVRGCHGAGTTRHEDVVETSDVVAAALSSGAE